MKISLRSAAALSLAALAAGSGFAQSIDVSGSEDRTSARGPEVAYTGVGIAQILFRANDDSDLTAASVTFEPGSRTAWHNHPAGQYLIVTSGVGWVQARGEKKRVIRAGDIVRGNPLAGCYSHHSPVGKAIVM